MINFSLLDEAFPNEDKKKNKKIKDKSLNDFDNSSINSKENCKTIQAPIYNNIPQNCINKDNFNDIINSSMTTNNIKNDYKNDGIKAFDFDEMDAYLNVSDIKSNNNDTSNEYKTTPFLIDYLKNLKNNFNQSISNSNDNFLNIEEFTNKNIKVDINLYNLFLFIFLGIIIILLIDQITKLVINSK